MVIGLIGLGLVVVIGVVVYLVTRKKTDDNKDKGDGGDSSKAKGISKPGNNGAVSCQTYCTGDYNGFPIYKKAVSATRIKDGKSIPIDVALGAEHDPDDPDPNSYNLNLLDCKCSDE